MPLSTFISYTQCSIIHDACLGGDIDVIKKYISDRGYVDTVDDADNSENGLLHLASKGGHVEIVHFLIEEGANVTDKNPGGLTALHLCSDNGDNVELAKLLVSKQATVEAESDVGTPLSYACKFGRLNIVKYLVEENGANSETTDQSGKTPIDIAR